MGALDRRLVLAMLEAVGVGEIIYFEDFARVFGAGWRDGAIYGRVGVILSRMRSAGRLLVTIRHVGYLRLPDGPRMRRMVFDHLDREIWAMAEAAPHAKLPA